MGEYKTNITRYEDKTEELKDYKSDLNYSALSSEYDYDEYLKLSENCINELKNNSRKFVVEIMESLESNQLNDTSTFITNCSNHIKYILGFSIPQIDLISGAEKRGKK